MTVNKELRTVIVGSMIAGTVITAFCFLLLVINIDPWYDPRYFIPIAGMIIGNSMTGILHRVEKLVGDRKQKMGVYRRKYLRIIGKCSRALLCHPQDY